MVLVEADPVIAKAVERLPGVEVLLIGAHRRPGIEMPLGERVGKLLAAGSLQMVEIGVIGEEIEDKDFHVASSSAAMRLGCLPGNARNAVATAAIAANTHADRNT